jgi:hypothetical protein
MRFDVGAKGGNAVFGKIKFATQDNIAVGVLCVCVFLASGYD